MVGDRLSPFLHSQSFALRGRQAGISAFLVLFHLLVSFKWRAKVAGCSPNPQQPTATIHRKDRAIAEGTQAFSLNLCFNWRQATSMSDFALDAFTNATVPTTVALK